MDAKVTAGTAEDGRPAMSEVAEELVAIAARAPSVHNTQPWRFRVVGDAVELRADPAKQLGGADPAGREMLISCGAALFGLRLAIRQLGYRPVVDVLPDVDHASLLAVVRLGAAAPIALGERRLVNALSRRHTHRGPFAAEPLPPGLMAALQRDAEFEAATLVFIHDAHRYAQLSTLLAATGRTQRQDLALTAETRSWTRSRSSQERDGVPARAYPVRASRRHGSLPQRDFDLGRGWGTERTEGGEPAATGVLTTDGDTAAAWLGAGQALHRVLLHAAHQWVFASLHTQVLESAPAREAVRTGLRLAGAPQVILQLGRAKVAVPTARRPAGEFLDGPGR
jgi:nitroreductase